MESEDRKREVRRLASEARHQALRELRELFPLSYRDLHQAALAERGLGKERGGK